MAPTPLLTHPLHHSYTLSRTSSSAGGLSLLVPQALSPIIGRPFPDLESVAKLTDWRYPEIALSGTFLGPC